jgi:DNA-directed RNA polymerase subunit RPC12/RpoP
MVNAKPEQTFNNHGVECPYCGYVDRDSWEWCDESGDDEHECGSCSKVFAACVSVSVTYTGTPTEKDQ